VRIHTNYRHHRDAALRALDAREAREDVARAIAARAAEDVETAIVREGGAAAMLRTPSEWAAHPQGRAVAAEPLILSETAPIPSGRRIDELRPGTPPLAGIRVVDLTRVIAGPICTRFLAAYGAEVLRLDPPGFAEVGALLPETTAGKRRASVDLRTEEGRAVLERLVVNADLLVCGYRSNALDRLGLRMERLREVNPALGVLLLDAYGWTGPWSQRRGFDSLVQMSTGIAAPRSDDAGGSRKPTPLPAQALDHGTGYLLAAAACRTLTERYRARVASVCRLSLARVARYLEDLGTNGDPGAPELSDVEPWRELAESSFGEMRRVRCPGRIDGIALPHWDLPAGALGVDAPVWRT
jgi:crotonobetainyl-CoA:carnitine CoA-transferase CaiB-like acyl-CoA transferase